MYIIRQPVSEKHLQLGVDNAPIPALACPFFRDGPPISHWPFVWHRRYPAIIYDLFAYPRRFVSGISYYCFYLWKSFNKLIIQAVKCYTVVDISGIYINAQHIAVFITGRLC